MPAVMAPALMVLFWADIKAKKLGVLSIAASSYNRRVKADEECLTWLQLTRRWWVQIDAVGLVILGSGWALVLLPFTLYKGAEGGWKNGGSLLRLPLSRPDVVHPSGSMVAMLVVGGVLLLFFILYEMKWAEHPLMPVRVLNRTFLCCVIIDVFYFISGNLRSTFFSSWVYVIKDW